MRYPSLEGLNVVPFLTPTMNAGPLTQSRTVVK